jgi:prephenate dehydratase
MTRVAIQGAPGSFSHRAAIVHFGPEVEVVSCTDLEALFAAVTTDEADDAVLPVENALAGAVPDALELVREAPVRACAEVYVRIELALCVRPGCALESLTRVASHPVALRQCRRFLARHPHLEAVPSSDTAGSIAALMKGGAAWDGAIGPAFAAELYGASIVAGGIEDHARNFTRFLVLERTGKAASHGPGDKASVTFLLPHRPGELHRALGTVAGAGADLTRLESQPIPGRPWEYRFYADLCGEDEGAVERAVRALEGQVAELRVLGIYGRVSPP